MTLTTLITVNAVLAAIVVYGIVLLHAHSVRHDRRHALEPPAVAPGRWSRRASRDRIAA